MTEVNTGAPVSETNYKRLDVFYFRRKLILTTTIFIYFADRVEEVQRVRRRSRP